MPTNPPTLEEFSPEVRASKLLGQKHNEDRQAADNEHRRSLAAPIEDRTVRLAKIAKGEPVTPYVDRESQIRAVAYRCRETREVCDLHYTDDQVIKQKALGALCKTLLEEKATLKRMATGLVQAHTANQEFQELKDYLIGQGGLVGICLTRPDKILGHPKDRTSDLALLLREFVAMGVLDKLPKSLA